MSGKIRNDKSDWLSMHANLRQRMKRVLTCSGELEVSRSMVASITREADISEEKVTN